MLVLSCNGFFRELLELNKPKGGRGKQAPYPSKVIRVPEVLHPIVEEMIEHLYESGEVLDKQSCNEFNSNQQQNIKQAIQLWINRWMDKAKGKEAQPRYKFLVDAVKEVQSIINE